MSKRSPSSLSFIAVMCVAACTGANTERQPALDQTFAQIQVDEAGIEHTRAVLADEDLRCDDKRRAMGEAKDYLRELCSLAHRSADADALERCDRGIRRCLAMEASLAKPCPRPIL
jgi:hypothetical protein